MRRALANMKSHAHYQANQAENFHHAHTILDMKKVELEMEVEVLRSQNEALRECVSTLEHALIIGVEACDGATVGRPRRNNHRRSFRRGSTKKASVLARGRSRRLRLSFFRRATLTRSDVQGVRPPLRENDTKVFVCLHFYVILLSISERMVHLLWFFP